jgi:hypothetical protein
MSSEPLIITAETLDELMIEKKKPDFVNCQKLENMKVVVEILISIVLMN